MATRTAGFLVLFVGACASGCVPLSQPLQFAETAEVLKKSAVKITAAGGLAAWHERLANNQGGQDFYWGGGVGARVRVGIGHAQEVGGEASVLWGDVSSEPLKKKPYQLQWKFAWKWAPLSWLALVGGLGGGIPVDGMNSHMAVGTDAALIASHRWGRVVPYVGARLGFTWIVAEPRPVGGLAAALGCSVDVAGPLSLLVEAGIPAYFSRNSTGGTDTGWGYYGLVGAALRFGP